MALSFACPCGQQLEIDDEYAGQPVACPSCSQTVTAPRRRAAVRSIAPPAAPALPVPPTASRGSAAGRRAVASGGIEDVRPKPKRKKRPKTWAERNDLGTRLAVFCGGMIPFGICVWIYFWGKEAERGVGGIGAIAGGIAALACTAFYVTFPHKLKS